MAIDISDQDIDSAVPNKGSSTPDPNSEQPSRKLLNNLLKNVLNDTRVALGSGALAQGGNSVALGLDALAQSGRSVALGSGATSMKTYAISIGTGALAGDHHSVALGHDALAEGYSSVALGLDASAMGDSSVALGRGASVEGSNSVALGLGALAMGSDEMQLGRSQSTVYYYAMAQRSDERDKADIKDTELGLNFISALKPRQFKWDYREDYKPEKPENFNELSDSAKKAWHESQKLSSITHDGTHKRIREHQGFIAQEVKQVMDELGVDFAGYQDKSITANDEDTKALAMLEFIAPMVKAIQELSARVEALEK